MAVGASERLVSPSANARDGPDDHPSTPGAHGSPGSFAERAKTLAGANGRSPETPEHPESLTGANGRSPETPEHPECSRE